MKNILRYLCISIGAAVAFSAVGLTALYFLGEHVISGQRTACADSGDFVAVRSNLAAALKDGTIDQPVMDREGKTIAKAQEACALGNQKKARVILMSVMMDAALQSDNVYERKINGKQGR